MEYKQSTSTHCETQKQEWPLHWVKLFPLLFCALRKSLRTVSGFDTAWEIQGAFFFNRDVPVSADAGKEKIGRSNTCVWPRIMLLLGETENFKARKLQLNRKGGKGSSVHKIFSQWKTWEYTNYIFKISEKKSSCFAFFSNWNITRDHHEGNKQGLAQWCMYSVGIFWLPSFHNNAVEETQLF